MEKKWNLRTIALAQMYKMWEETERHVQLKKKTDTGMKLRESIIKSDPKALGLKSIYREMYRVPWAVRTMINSTNVLDFKVWGNSQ